MFPSHARTPAPPPVTPGILSGPGPGTIRETPEATPGKPVAARATLGAWGHRKASPTETNAAP
ncbi:hypothetical protein GCM10017567_24660 [Amycolatopsis bullii]|uniref:Uncharacterized protein n=1 Tax=Amycolatopsis bullii TaxID=941987 RepID=A0ABQ3KBG0_9PSEU|nr:hypothetical protein GCM10017567_24660 [Amycolatopsis bullii]